MILSRYNRYMYATISNDVGLSTPPQGICRVDLSVPNSSANTGSHSGDNGVQCWYPGVRCFTNEPVVIPRSSSSSSSSSSSGSSEQDNVYVITNVEDAEAGRNYVAVLDGSNISAGPIAKVWLPYLPHAIHGCWTSETFECFKKQKSQ
jgi:carotenoid cleavage dioxygenase-like enzyme